MHKFTNKNEERIVKRNCDTAMAEKKGYLPCKKNCRTCHASIETLGTGERRHCVPK